MLAAQLARDKLHSTFVAIQEVERKLNFCRRVDMGKFSTNFSLIHSSDEKILSGNRRAGASTENYFWCETLHPFRTGTAKLPK
jgi:hypothetical protein